MQSCKLCLKVTLSQYVMLDMRLFRTATIVCGCVLHMLEKVHSLLVSHTATPSSLLQKLIQRLGHIVVEHHFICYHLRRPWTLYHLCCRVDCILSFLQSTFPVSMMSPKTIWIIHQLWSLTQSQGPQPVIDTTVLRCIRREPKCVSRPHFSFWHSMQLRVPYTQIGEDLVHCSPQNSD